MAILVSIATLLLTSPLLIEHYNSAELTYEAKQMSHGDLKIEFDNEGRRSAKDVRIEIADRYRDKLLSINEIKVIPPKKYGLREQDSFEIIDFKDAFLPGEKVIVFIKSDIDDRSYPYLWIRVTHKDGEMPHKPIMLISDN